MTQAASLLLDLADERAWLGEAPLALTPKAFAVLRYLALHRDRLVTKDELLREVWPDAAVSDSSLTTAIREIRRALGDGPSRPTFIQTVHRRGYRFVGTVHGAAPPGARAAPATVASARAIVGRAEELARLGEWLAAAEAGARQIVLVSGEAGVGKTAVADAFLADAAARPGVRVARGQCIESYGAAEAFLPWLDALGSLCRTPRGGFVVQTLREVAPMWLAQLPAVVGAEEREVLLRQVAGAPPERMLREMAEAVERLTQTDALVLALEDLHWADRSSLDLLAFIARRREPARLLVLATLRPFELGAAVHPLRVKQELVAHRLCHELPIGFLSLGAVSDYVAARFPGLRETLGAVLHRRTDGNALFMVNTADYLVTRGLVKEEEGRWTLCGDIRAVEASVPASLRALIDRQLDQVGPQERALLSAGSVVGAHFSDVLAAHLVQADVEPSSDACEGLARRGQFLTFASDEEWPDGTPTRRYAFIHALYADVLYASLTPSQRARLHRRAGERLEQAFGDRVGQIAAELATHFEQSRDHARAVSYLSLAASNAAERAAYPEVIRGLTRALDLLALLPDDASRAQREFALRMALAPAEMVTRGYAAVEVDEAFARAEALARQTGDERQLFGVLMGRSAAVLLAGRTGEAQALGEECCRIARRRQSPRYLTQAETALGISRFFRGELAAAANDLERSRIAYGAVKQLPPGFRLLHDPGAAGRSYAAWAQWILGFPARARLESEAAIALARELSHPFSLAFALAFGAFVEQARGDVSRTRERAEETIAVCREHGFAMYLAVGAMFRGWAVARAGQLDAGIAEMEAGLVDYGNTGAMLVQPYFLALIAELVLRRGDAERALALVARAFEIGRRSEESIHDAELHRLAGEARALQALAGGGGGAAAAEERFADALAIARAQRARSLELRAVVSLARFRQRSGRGGEVAAQLREVHGAFVEGSDTADLRDAALLLASLA